MIYTPNVLIAIPSQSETVDSTFVHRLPGYSGITSSVQEHFGDQLFAPDNGGSIPRLDDLENFHHLEMLSPTPRWISEAVMSETGSSCQEPTGKASWYHGILTANADQH